LNYFDIPIDIQILSDTLLNMNINTVRIARKLNKISVATSARLMRRLGRVNPKANNWEAFCALRASIMREVKPQIQAARDAEEWMESRHRTTKRRYIDA